MDLMNENLSIEDGVGQDIMLQALLYVSIVQLAAKDWELIPPYHLGILSKIGGSLQQQLLAQIYLDLETFQVDS
jgi:hypothetical protein